MDQSVVDDIMNRLLEVRGRPGKQVQLSESEIRQLCVASKDIFLQQPNLLELEAPIKICGIYHLLHSIPSPFALFLVFCLFSSSQHAFMIPSLIHSYLLVPLLLACSSFQIPPISMQTPLCALTFGSVLNPIIL